MNIPLNIDWQQILLHLFNFAILAVGLYLLLYKPVMQFMEKRDAYYKELAVNAEQKVQKAEEMQADYQKKLAEAEQEISQKKAEASRALEDFRNREISAAKSTAEGIIAEARKSAENESTKILEDSQRKIADTAISAAKKIVRNNISEEQEKSLFEEMLKKVGENCGE
jgi:F-type H+-transporting ATPase subunit b